MCEFGVISVASKVYLSYVKSKRYSGSTLRQYAYSLRTFASFLAVRGLERLQDVTTDDLEGYHRYLKDKGLSLGGRENLMRAVRKFFQWLEATGRIFDDPSRNVVMPKRTKGILQVPTEAEMKRLLAQPNVLRPIGLRDRALIEVAYGCGLRRGELEALTIFDPDLQQGTLRVLGKGRKERIVPLGSQAVHWLRKYLKHSRPKLLKGKVDLEALWISTQATPMQGMSIRQQLYVYVRKARIETPMNLHSLRKACVTHMLAHGAHPVQIQMLLGHADLKHLGEYLNVTITDLKKAHKRTRPGR